MKKFSHFLAAIGAALVLTACGGGGGGGGGGGASAATDGVPTGALASVDGFVSYMQQLVSDMSETLEAFTLPDAALPTTETVETSV